MKWQSPLISWHFTRILCLDCQTLSMFLSGYGCWRVAKFFWLWFEFFNGGSDYQVCELRAAIKSVLVAWRKRKVNLSWDGWNQKPVELEKHFCGACKSGGRFTESWSMRTLCGARVSESLWVASSVQNLVKLDPHFRHRKITLASK